MTHVYRYKKAQADLSSDSIIQKHTIHIVILSMIHIIYGTRTITMYVRVQGTCKGHLRDMYM